VTPIHVQRAACHMKVQIVIRPVGERPLFVIEENDHELAVEQFSGFTRDGAVALAGLLLHQGRGNLLRGHAIARFSLAFNR
jgi:hypothetical protein